MAPCCVVQFGSAFGLNSFWRPCHVFFTLERVPQGLLYQAAPTHVAQTRNLRSRHSFLSSDASILYLPRRSRAVRAKPLTRREGKFGDIPGGRSFGLLRGRSKGASQRDGPREAFSEGHGDDLSFVEDVRGTSAGGAFPTETGFDSELHSVPQKGKHDETAVVPSMGLGVGNKKAGQKAESEALPDIIEGAAPEQPLTLEDRNREEQLKAQVVSILGELGMSEADISGVLKRYPGLPLAHEAESLQKKFDVLTRYGLRPEAVLEAISSFPRALGRQSKDLAEIVAFLLEEVGIPRGELAFVITRSGCLCCPLDSALKPTVAWLKDFVGGDVEILVRAEPKILRSSLDRFEERASILQEHLGAEMTVELIQKDPIVFMASASTLNRNLEELKQLCPDEALKPLIWKDPRVLTLAWEENLQPKLMYFAEHGFSAGDVLKAGVLFCSFKRKIRPRLEFLKAKGVQVTVHSQTHSMLVESVEYQLQHGLPISLRSVLSSTDRKFQGWFPDYISLTSLQRAGTRGMQELGHLDKLAVILQGVGLTHEDALSVLKNIPAVDTFSTERLQERLELLRNYGFVGEDLVEVLKLKPSIVHEPQQRVVNVMKTLQEDIDIPREWMSRVVCGSGCLMASDDALQARVSTLKRLLSSNVSVLVGRQPRILNFSSEHIQKAHAFLLGVYGSDELLQVLVKCPNLLFANCRTMKSNMSELKKVLSPEDLEHVLLFFPRALGCNWKRTMLPKLQYFNERCGFSPGEVFRAGVAGLSLEEMVRRVEYLEAKGILLTVGKRTGKKISMHGLIEKGEPLNLATVMLAPKAKFLHWFPDFKPPMKPLISKVSGGSSEPIEPAGE